MQTFRRYITILMLALWMGGFTFYALVVIPTATQVLGNERQVGFTTRQVTHWLNLIGLVALAVFIWNAVAERANQTPRRRFWINLACATMLLAHAGLFTTHRFMDQLLNPQAFKIHDYDHFVNLHTVYLWFATTQWVAALTYLWIMLATWTQPAQSMVASGGCQLHFRPDHQNKADYQKHMADHK